jgi:hypothetical protein
MSLGRRKGAAQPIENTLLPSVQMTIHSFTKFRPSHRIQDRGNKTMLVALSARGAAQPIRNTILPSVQLTIHSFTKFVPSHRIDENSMSESFRLLQIRDHYERFCGLMAIADSFGMVLRSIAVDNLPVQVSGLQGALQMSGSPAIHMKCFTYIVSLVLASTVSTSNFSRIMNHLADLQQLPRPPLATAQLGIKSP